MTTIPQLLKVRAPVPVAEPRGSVAVAHLTDGFLRLGRFIDDAARMVWSASRSSHGSWRE